MAGNLNKETFENLLSKLDKELDNLNYNSTIEVYEIGDYAIIYANHRKIGNGMKVYTRKDEVFKEAVERIGEIEGIPDWFEIITKDKYQGIPDIDELPETSFKEVDLVYKNIELYCATDEFLLYLSLITKRQGDVFKDIVLKNNLSLEETKIILKPYLKFYDGDKQLILERLNKCENISNMNKINILKINIKQELRSWLGDNQSIKG